MEKIFKLTLQYINAVPSKNAVKMDEIANYEFSNREKILLLNYDIEYALDYITLIAIDKMITSFTGIEKVALIRSNHQKYPGLQVIIEGDIRFDKCLIPKYISWEKLENHQKTIEELLPIYED